MIPGDEDGEVRVERRQGKDVTPKLRSKKISPEQEKELVEVLGLSLKEIYNRRGWLNERGIVNLMEPGDRIVEVTATHAVLETASGVRQTFWNIARDLPFLRKAESKSP